MLESRLSYLATLLSVSCTVFSQSTTASADQSTITGPVVTAFLPNRSFPPYGSLKGVGVSDPFNIIIYCPQGKTTSCGFPYGDGGTYTAAPSSFFATGVTNRQYLYTIDCSLPNPTSAVCTSTTYGPFGTGADGFINVSQTSFAATTATNTLSGSQVTRYPITLTAGATQFLSSGVATSTISTPTSSITTPAPSPEVNGASKAMPHTWAAIMVLAVLFLSR